MMEPRRAASLGTSSFDGVSSIHHFCFGPYQSATRLDWGRLRMLNRLDIAPHGRREANFLAGMDVLLIVEGGAIEAELGGRRCRIGQGTAALLTTENGTNYGFKANGAPAQVIEIWLRRQAADRMPSLSRYRSPLVSSAELQAWPDSDWMAFGTSRIRAVRTDATDSEPLSVQVDQCAYVTVLEGQVWIDEFDLSRDDSIAIEESQRIRIMSQSAGAVLILDRLGRS